MINKMKERYVDMELSTKQRLQIYVPLVDFIADVLGKNTEVVLHDATDLDHSIIAIRNNYISNREVGGPATNLVLKMVKENKTAERDYIANYKGINKFNKNLRSSSLFIRDDEQKMIGVLCVNTDDTMMNNLHDIINELHSIHDQPSEDNEFERPIESLSISIEEMALNEIQEITKLRNIKIDQLKQSDKLEIIETLYLKGIFLLKGAVVEAAKALKISEASVYRYVQKIKRKEDELISKK